MNLKNDMICSHNFSDNFFAKNLQNREICCYFELFYQIQNLYSRSCAKKIPANSNILGIRLQSEIYNTLEAVRKNFDGFSSQKCVETINWGNFYV